MPSQGGGGSEQQGKHAKEGHNPEKCIPDPFQTDWFYLTNLLLINSHNQHIWCQRVFVQIHTRAQEDFFAREDFWVQSVSKPSRLHVDI